MAIRYESAKHPLFSMTVPVANPSLSFLQERKEMNSRMINR